MNKEKIFYSMDAVRRYYFPKAYQREIEEKVIKEKGMGRVLAEEFLKHIRKRLRKK